MRSKIPRLHNDTMYMATMQHCSRPALRYGVDPALACTSMLVNAMTVRGQEASEIHVCTVTEKVLWCTHPRVNVVAIVDSAIRVHKGGISGL